MGIRRRHRDEKSGQLRTRLNPKTQRGKNGEGYLERKLKIFASDLPGGACGTITSSEVEDPNQECSPGSGDAPQEKCYPRKPEVPSDQGLPVQQ